jgi:hypothetical protein
MALLPTAGEGASSLPADSSLATVVAQLNADGFDGSAFESWYGAAVKKDPALTPVQGAPIWLAGTSIAKGLGTAATGSANATVQAAKGAVAGAEEAEQTLNPLSWFGGLSVVSLLKIVFGGTLLLVGIVHLAGIDSGTIATIARKVPVPV